MGDSLEDLLAQLKAQYQGGSQADKNQPGEDQPNADAPPISMPSPAKSQSSSPQPSQLELPVQPDSIDNLLSQIEGKSTPQGANVSPPPLSGSSKAFPASSSAPQTDWQQLKALADQKREQDSSTFPSQAQPSSSDALLNDLKRQYQAQDQAEALKQQEQQRAEQLRQEQLKQKKRTQAIKQAEAWLKTLDPRSGEAVWFEEFASKYESRVDAAIDYLGLLAES